MVTSTPDIKHDTAHKNPADGGRTLSNKYDEVRSTYGFGIDILVLIAGGLTPRC